MTSLTQLKNRLAAATTEPMARPWEIGSEIDGEIVRLNSYLKNGSSQFIPRDLQIEAINRFWVSKKFENLKDARLVSFGVALPVGPQQLCVIEDRERFPAALDGVDQFLSDPRLYRRCYQGLLSGYFFYDPMQPRAQGDGERNWNKLRMYLASNVSNTRGPSVNPEWVDVAQKNVAIFSKEPCSPYGEAMLTGQKEEVDAVLSALSISDASWFSRRLLLAQIEAAKRRGDAEFHALLYRLLSLLDQNEVVRDEGLALVLNHYAAIKPTPMALPLRDRAVGWWGNPWLSANSMRWSRASSAARALVTDWLKLEFIEAFFSLLADERTGDQRRLKFWKRYVHAIDSIHFALGSAARNSRAKDFVELRKKMTGLSVPLQDQARENNAFIMQMGGVAIVEFGTYSNACYGYDAKRSLPFDVSKPVVTPVDAENSLKQSTHVLKLRHQDGILGWSRWEDRFEATLKRNFGVVPKAAALVDAMATTERFGPGAPPQMPQGTSASPRGSVQIPVLASPPAEYNFRSEPRRLTAPPAPAREVASAEPTALMWKSMPFSRGDFERYARAVRLTVEDLSNRNGNLWVRTGDANLKVNEILLNWGFRYKPGKGWWK